MQFLGRNSKSRKRERFFYHIPYDERTPLTRPLSLEGRTRTKPKTPTIAGEAVDLWG